VTVPDLKYKNMIYCKVLCEPHAFSILMFKRQWRHQWWRLWWYEQKKKWNCISFTKDFAV